MGYAFNLLLCCLLVSITTATAQSAEDLTAVQGAGAPPASSNTKSLSKQSQQQGDEPSTGHQAAQKQPKKKKLKQAHRPADAVIPAPSGNLMQQTSGEPEKGSQQSPMNASPVHDKRKFEDISADEIHQRIEAAAANVPKVTKKSKQSFYVYRSPEIEEKPSPPPKPRVLAPLNGLKPQKSLPIAKQKPALVDEIALFAAEMHRAELGDAEAQLQVGMKVYQGKGAAQDRKKGFVWLLKAAENGKFSPESLNILGRAYFNGIDIEKNYSEARKWFIVSAGQDNATAKNDLAYMLYNGLGGDRDYAKAFELYKQLAKHGDVLAQANLGTMYAAGTGTAMDKARAYAWYTFAANQGNVAAANNRNALLMDLSWEELNLAQKISIELYNEFESREAERPPVHKGQLEHAEPVKNRL